MTENCGGTAETAGFDTWLVMLLDLWPFDEEIKVSDTALAGETGLTGEMTFDISVADLDGDAVPAPYNEEKGFGERFNSTLDKIKHAHK